MKINLQQKNYTTKEEKNQNVILIDCESMIPENDSVRLLNAILEEIDYTRLYDAYSLKGTKPAVEPKIMFKILVYAYLNGIYSTRKIADACRRDINFIWLLSGEKGPHRSTVARFRTKRLKGILGEMFGQFIKLLKEYGEIQYKNLFEDGTKIESAANRYTFVWRKTIEKNEAKMHIKIKELVDEINESYKTEFEVREESIVEDMEEVGKYLENKRVEDNIEFVNGKGKRKSEIQKFTEPLNEYKERQAGYDESKEILGERNSYSKTDNDATFMRMKDDHMQNGQLKPAYNVQIGVEAEYIVGVGVYENRNDLGTMIPFLDRLEESLGVRYENIVADAGYESEENYKYLEKNGQTSYIKPQNYDKGVNKKDIGKRENMEYDEKTDEYKCYKGRILKKKGETTRTSATGYESEITIYECEDCSGCEHKEKCTKAQGNKKMQVSKEFVKKREESLANITTETGKLLRVNRSIQVEGAFGVIKSDRGFDRFETRGKENVEIEIMLVCLGYNISKLHSKIQSGRCGQYLHELKEKIEA